MTPEEIARSIADRDFESALSALLVIWRQARSPELGEHIERVSALVSRERIAESTRRKRYTVWKQIAAASDAADVGRLLRGLPDLTPRMIEAGLGVFSTWPTDPRFASMACQLITRQPDGLRGPNSHPIWHKIFETLVRNADQRHRDAMEAFQRKLAEGGAYGRGLLSYGLIRFLPPALTEALAAMSENENENDPVDEFNPIARALAKLAQPVHDRTLAELFTAVYDDPTSDAARAVLSDALLERNDPRGELIALQLQPERTPEQTKREADLLLGYGRDWLGGLAAATHKKTFEFDRGFVSSLRLGSKVRDYQRLARQPEWRTVTALDVGAYRGNHGELIASLPWLEKLEGLYATALPNLALPNLAMLSLERCSPASFQHLTRSAFPCLSSLHLVHGAEAPDVIGESLKEGLVFSQLRELIITRSSLASPGFPENWLAAGCSHPWPFDVIDLRVERTMSHRLRLIRGEDDTIDTVEWSNVVGTTPRLEPSVDLSWIKRFRFAGQPPGDGDYRQEVRDRLAAHGLPEGALEFEPES